MFVSAGVDLKVHFSTPQGVENHEVAQAASTSKIIGLSICNDNSYVALLRENEKPQIFSLKDPQNVRLIHTINVSNIAALTFKHNTKKNIAMGTLTGDVIIYDTKQRSVQNIHNKVTDSVRALDFTCDDQQLCGFDGNIFFVFPDVNNNSHLKRYKQAKECTFLKCHPFIHNRVALGCANGHVGVWDVQEGVELVGIDFGGYPVTGLSMSSCGSFLLVGGKNLKICGLDYNSGTSTFQYNVDQEKGVSSVDLSPDDKYLAVGLTDGTLKLYDVKEQLKEIYASKLHDTSINFIVFENKAKEPNSNFSSVMKLSEESKEPDLFETFSGATIKGKLKVRTDHRDESLEKMKRHLLKMIKNEMDCLECQLQEHCVKFQKFLDNEFETIDGIIKKKWDIFNMGDMNQIVKAICPEDSKSTCD